MKTRILFLLAFVVMCCTTAMAQITVKGNIVSDKDSEPMIGVAILEQGTSNGTITDIDGNFSLTVKSNATLVVSYVGYNTQTVKVSGSGPLNIRLVEDSKLLDDVVVIGYGTQRKSDLTGSVASVKADDLKDLSTTDAAAALQGKVSGVQILSTGGPGAGAEIRVRGYSSNSGNIGPLLIVDGLQVSSIQYLDPSMIESMEVLKDAASAAIYGAEAGNGVVLITTKNGGNNKVSVSYNMKATRQNFSKRPTMRRDDFIRYIGLEYGEDYINARLQNWDYKHPGYENGVIDQDWISAYIEPTWNIQHSLSFSGGNDRGHFFTSLNIVNNNGVIRGDKDVYKRLSAQINADYKLFKWLTVGTNNSIEKWSTKSVSHRGYASSFDSMIVMDPLTPVYWTTPEEMSQDVKRVYDELEAGTSSRPYRLFKDENGWFANTKYSDLEGSPLAKRDATDSSNGGFNINGTLFANLNLFKGFVFTSRLGYRISQSSSHSYTSPYYIGPRGSQDNYSISATANTGYYYQWENFANYMIDFGKNNITAMAGMSYRENNSDNVTGSSSGADILSSYEPNFQYLDYVKGDASKTISNAPNRSSSLAYFGRLMYSYDNRYSIQANFRADAYDSSKLSKENRWGFFPSVSAGWTLSNEKFFSEHVNSEIVNFIKFRGSWGRNGNINVLSGYPYASTIALGNSWYQYGVDHIGSTPSSSPSGIPNPDLHWEISEQYDFGLDTRFFNNKLSFAVDYFRKTTKDLLFDVPVTPEIGTSSIKKNAGSILNSGLEFEASWKDKVGDFSYSVTANFSTLHNEVLSLPAGVPIVTKTDASSTNYPIQTAFEEGMPVWYIRGYEYLGMKDDGTGKMTYVLNDKNGDGTLDASDFTKIGSGIPTFTYGINVNLAWKDIDFTFFGAGQGGNQIMPVLHRTGVSNTFKWYLEQYDKGNYPHPSNTVGQFNFWSSSANIFSGAFFRIKQLQLGYTIPRKWTKKALINNLRVYASLDDFFTFTSYPGLDPETASTNTSSGAGLDWGSYPTMEKLVLGLNITF